MGARRALVYTVLVALGAAPAVGFLIADRMANAAPRASSSAGWVAVMADHMVTNAPGGATLAHNGAPVGQLDHAELQVGTVIGARQPAPAHGVFVVAADHPGETRYTVVVCGSGTVRVALVLGGDAVLADPVEPVSVNDPALTAAEFTRTAALNETAWRAFKAPLVPAGFTTVSGFSLGQHTALVQMFEATVTAQPCPAAQAAPAAAPVTFFAPRPPGPSAEVGGADAVTIHGATAIDVAGDPLRRVTHHYDLGPWRGPHTWVSWPAIDQPPVQADDQEMQIGGSGWVPAPVQTVVDAGSVPLTDAVDAERPDSDRPELLRWSVANAAVAPTLRITDQDSLRTWQSILTAMTILLAVGGGVIASVVIDGASRWSDQKKTATPISVEEVDADGTHGVTVAEGPIGEMHDGGRRMRRRAVAAGAVGAVIAAAVGVVVAVTRHPSTPRPLLPDATVTSCARDAQGLVRTTLVVHNPVRASERYFVQLRVFDATGKPVEGIPDVVNEVVGPRRTVTSQEFPVVFGGGPPPFACKVVDVVRQTP